MGALSLSLMTICTSQTFSENVVANIHKAVEEKQWQWGLRLCDMILDGQEEEELEEVRGLRSECLKELAAREVSAPGRNWYRTEDMVMAGLEIKPSKQARAAHRAHPGWGGGGRTVPP